jgi:predicted RNA-binding protein Jag
MSGHKIATVTISQEEYRRLYEAERNLRFEIEETALRETASQPRRTESIFDQLLRSNLPQNQNGAEDNVVRDHSIIDERRGEENRLSTHLSEVQDLIQRESERNSRLLHDSDTQIKTLTEKVADLTAQIQANQTEAHALQIENFTYGLNANDAIENLINRITYFLNQIDLFQSTAFYHPEKIEEIEAKVDFALEYEAQGYQETALSILSHALIEANLYNTQIENHAADILAVQAVLLDRLDLLLAQISANSMVRACHRNGEISNVSLDLHEWADGKYEQIYQDALSLQQWLLSNGQHLSYTEMKEVERRIGEIDSQFDDVILLAQANALNSQMKYEVANQVVLALVSQGFIPTAGDFCVNNGDERYFAEASNGEGSVVSVIIDPIPGNPVANSISVLSSDAKEKTGYELRQRANAIHDAVEKYGFQISKLEEVTEGTSSIEGDQLNRSIHRDRWKKRQ